MDADRFDFLTKSLTARFTRRGLGLLGGLGLGARVASWDADAKKKGKKKKKRKKKPQPACTVSQSEATASTTLTVIHKDLSLTTSDRIPLDPGEVLTSTTTIKLKQALLQQMTMSYQRDGQTSVQILYGNAYQGIERAELTTDGETVSGTVDGRAIVPFAASAQLETFQFQDGQPAPPMSLSEDLTQQLAQLYARAETQAEQCAVAKGSRVSGVTAQRHTSLECLSCVGACAAGAAYCGVLLKGPCAAASVACFFGAPACFAGCMALGFAGCALAAVACVDICARGPCCAIPCYHTNGDTFCCEQGQTCLRPGACCGAGRFPCQGQNCCASAERCLPGGACCEHPDFPCGQNCCGPFTGLCCNGVCCNGECINGACCTPPNLRCGNTCCATTCCNNVCCPAGQACHPTTGQCAVLCASNQEYCPALARCCDPGRTCCKFGTSWLCSLTACAPN